MQPSLPLPAPAPEAAKGPHMERSAKAHVPLQRNLPGPHGSKFQPNNGHRYMHRKIPR
jgi:hypothetical protein